MRLWSIHPKYLDAKGLVALWREGLLAQNVLLEKTKGYKNHPQLLRFKQTLDPQAAIGTYLHAVVDEADRRGYKFHREKIVNSNSSINLPVNSGQVQYEFEHLLNKLKIRDIKRYNKLHSIKKVEIHPIFEEVLGKIEAWEII
ncbi:pyrimidine dimer DNA glycosylase/endonuclease V [Sulfurimonas sp.]|uniref:pyrimidine dimer DNA glycosylase/endonuclease V n=1 Tax=Sulfurimonas sp. TaxID=2022749 RepID=UPI003D135C55